MTSIYTITNVSIILPQDKRENLKHEYHKSMINDKEKNREKMVFIIKIRQIQKSIVTAYIQY